MMMLLVGSATTATASMNHSDSDDRTSTTSASSQGYNVPSTLAPNQRDLRKQAAVRNAAAAEAALKTDEEAEEKQAEKLKRGHSSLPPLDTSSTSYAGKEGAQTASKTASDAIFAQLEVIQTLQVSLFGVKLLEARQD